MIPPPAVSASGLINTQKPPWRILIDESYSFNLSLGKPNTLSIGIPEILNGSLLITQHGSNVWPSNFALVVAGIIPNKSLITLTSNFLSSSNDGETSLVIHTRYIQEPAKVPLSPML